MLFDDGRFKDKYRIATTRMQCWDYSDDGYYFVTICTSRRIECFGNIKNGEVILSELGIITKKCWLEIPGHFTFVALDEFIIMPNHVHGILRIMGARGDAGVNANTYTRRDAINRVSTILDGGVTGEHNPMGKKTLGEIIRWFKGNCSFFIHQISTEFKWQPRYYDHVIRSEKSLNGVREYIKFNPFRWDYDRNNLANLKPLYD